MGLGGGVRGQNEVEYIMRIKIILLHTKVKHRPSLQLFFGGPQAQGPPGQVRTDEQRPIHTLWSVSLLRGVCVCVCFQRWFLSCCSSRTSWPLVCWNHGMDQTPGSQCVCVGGSSDLVMFHLLQKRLPCPPSSQPKDLETLVTGLQAAPGSFLLFLCSSSVQVSLEPRLLLLAMALFPVDPPAFTRGSFFDLGRH